eukprot:gene14354-biopygen23114
MHSADCVDPGKPPRGAWGSPGPAGPAGRAGLAGPAGPAGPGWLGQPGRHTWHEPPHVVSRMLLANMRQDDITIRMVGIDNRRPELVGGFGKNSEHPPDPAVREKTPRPGAAGPAPPPPPPPPVRGLPTDAPKAPGVARPGAPRKRRRAPGCRALGRRWAGRAQGGGAGGGWARFHFSRERSKVPRDSVFRAAMRTAARARSGRTNATGGLRDVRLAGTVEVGQYEKSQFGILVVGSPASRAALWTAVRARAGPAIDMDGTGAFGWRKRARGCLIQKTVTGIHGGGYVASHTLVKEQHHTVAGAMMWSRHVAGIAENAPGTKVPGAAACTTLPPWPAVVGSLLGDA